jgi:SAM-dependent methyltransferase
MEASPRPAASPALSPFAVDRARLIAYYGERAAASEGEDDTWGASEGFDPSVLETILEWAREAALASPGRPALDCACGTGRLAGALARLGIPTFGVDLVAAMAARARAKAERAAAVTAPAAASSWLGEAAPPRPAPARVIPRFAVGDAAALPLRPGAFGLVLDVEAFHHYPDPAAVAREWARVLAPRGTLIFADAVEKEPDATDFLTSLARAAEPGIVARYPRADFVGAILAEAGFAIERVAVFRLRKSFDRPCGDRTLPAGAARALAESAIGIANPEVRELYELNEEGMTWRFLALTARKM